MIRRIAGPWGAAFLTLAAWLLTLPTPSDAQIVAGFSSAIQQADLLYFAGNPAASFEVLDPYVKEHPDDYEALWRAARAAVILGVSQEGSRAQNRWLDPAMELAADAVALRPDGIDGLYWHGAATGRRAINAAPRRSAELAQIVYDDAQRILELDPTHGGAHNLLGKLSFEVMSLSRVERAMGRLLAGNEALASASWDNAERYLSAAAREWPQLVLFQLDLGLVYRKRGKDAEARAALTRALELPAVLPPDRAYQEQARRLLEDLEGR